MIQKGLAFIKHEILKNTIDCYHVDSKVRFIVVMNWNAKHLISYRLLFTFTTDHHLCYFLSKHMRDINDGLCPIIQSNKGHYRLVHWGELTKALHSLRKKIVQNGNEFFAKTLTAPSYKMALYLIYQELFILYLFTDHRYFLELKVFMHEHLNNELFMNRNLLLQKKQQNQRRNKDLNEVCFMEKGEETWLDLKQRITSIDGLKIKNFLNNTSVLSLVWYNTININDLITRVLYDKDFLWINESFNGESFKSDTWNIRTVYTRFQGRCFTIEHLKQVFFKKWQCCVEEFIIQLCMNQFDNVNRLIFIKGWCKTIIDLGSKGGFWVADYHSWKQGGSYITKIKYSNWSV